MCAWTYALGASNSHHKFRVGFPLRLESLEARDVPSLNSLAPLPPPWAQVFHGDFNGDAKQDVAGITSAGRWWVSLSTGTAFTPRTQWAQWSVAGSWTKLFVADANGDGKDDIVGFGFTGAWFVGLSNGADQFVRGSAPWARWSVPSTWRQLFVADFNGDGKADIAGFGNNGAWFVGRSNGTDNYASGKAWAHWSVSSAWNRLFVGDFNGDGKSDVAGFAFNGSWFVGVGNGTDAFTTGARWAQWSVPGSWIEVFAADFDCDGKTDIGGNGVTNTPGSARNFFVGVSNGADSFVTGPWGFVLNSYAAFFAVDANSDDKADLVSFEFYHNRFGQDLAIWIVFYSNGVNGFSPGLFDHNWLVPPNNWAQVFVGDFTGDGQADFAGFKPFPFELVNNTPPPVHLPPSWYVNEFSSNFTSETRWVSW